MRAKPLQTHTCILCGGPAGRDRTVSIWDHMVKKRLWQYPKYALRVQDIAFNVDRLWLVVGVSYGWEHSEDTPVILFGGRCGCSDSVGENEEGERLWIWQERRRR